MIYLDIQGQSCAIWSSTTCL